MRKKKYLKSATSVVLAVTLLFGQVITTGAADIFTDQSEKWDSDASFGDEEKTGEEVITESDIADLFTDGSDSAEEEKSEEAFASEEETETVQEAAEKPEVAASILASEEEINRWHINADWITTNAQEHPVTLALVMDDQTRQALPQEWQADADGICHFTLTDGTELPLTIRTDENAPEKIYLTSEQNGNGEYHLDFVLDGAEIKADLHSVLDMVVYDEDSQAWSQVAHAELDWRTVQEEEPDPTEAPEQPSTEETAETPEVPEEVTETPESPEEATETPETPEEATETPEAPEEATETPEAPEEEIETPETPEEATEVPESPEEETETPEAPEETTETLEEATEISVQPAPAEATEIPEKSEPTEDSSETESDKIPGEDETDTGTETVTEEIEPNIEEEKSEQSSKYASGASAEVEGVAVGTTLSGVRKAKSVMQDSIDMSDYITDAKFTPTEIEEGELVQLSISYKIQSSEIIQAGTNKLTYQLPEGIAPFETASGTVYNKNREAVGTYEITDTGSITITFNDTFVQSGNSITGDIHFWTLLSAEGDGEEHEYTFSESNQIIAKIKVKKDESESDGDTEEKTDIYVKKQETSFDKETQTAAYEITVGTNHGTKGDISFNDDFAEAEDASGSKVTGTIRGGSIVKIGTDGKSTNLAFDDYFNTANGDITLKDGTKLPALSAGERYVITYNMQFTGIDQMNGDVNLANAVTVWDERSNSSDRVDIGFNHTYIKKTSTYDTNNNKINWQIMLNDFGADLTGYELKDTLEKNGTTVSLPDTVTLTEYLDDGSTVDRKISLPYTFSSENVVSTKHKFVVSYSTDVSEDGFYTEYRNTASVGAYTSGSGQGIKHDQGVLSKTYVQPSKDEEIELEKVDDNTRNYLWNVVITAPSDGIKENSYYLDKISAAPYAALSYHYITAVQLSNIGVNYADQYEDLYELDSKLYEVQVKSGEDWVNIEGQSGSFTEFRLLFKENLQYPKIVLSYRTTADLSGMQNGNTWEFKNSGEFYQDGGSTSDYDSTKEAKGGYLKKIDAGPNKGTYVYDECKGILYYRIIVNETHVLKAGDGTIKIVDLLPPGTTLYTKPYKLSDMNTEYGSVDQSGDLNDRIVKIYFGGENTLGFYSDTGMQGVSFNINDKIPPFVYDEQKNEITVIIPEEVYLMRDNGHSEASSRMISIFYAVQITDALEKGESKEYTNSAKMYLDDTEKAGDTVTDTVSSSYITKRQENLAQDGTNEASYQILVNPTGAQLAGGSNLTLSDVVDYSKHQVTYTLNGKSYTKPYIQSVGLKANSLHLYKLNSDGSKGSEISTALYTVHYGEEPADDPTQFKMEIVVPDETPCVLEYTYKFSVNEQVLKSAGKDSYDVTNDINLSGSVTDESGDKSEIKLQDSGATADTDSLLLTKVDEDNQVVYLKGAVFQLQKYTGEKGTSDWSADQHWTNVKIYVTGENGTASLSGLEKNTAYRLKEIEAPTNYINSETMQYFYIGSDESGFPEEFITEANKYNTSTGSIIISNKKSNTDDTAVSVDKQWLDARGKALDEVVDKDGNIIDSITVNLYQKTEKNSEITASDQPFKTGILSHDDENNWYYTFNNLPKTDSEGNQYYYYVREGTSAEAENGTSINLAESYETSLDVEEGIRGGTFHLTNTKKIGKTQVTVTKRWAEGSTPTEVPVTLYRSKTKAPGISDKSVSVDVEIEGSNGGELSVIKQYNIINTGTNITLVINSDKDVFPDTLSYQMGSAPCYAAAIKTIEIRNGWQTRYVWTYVLENVTANVQIKMSVEGYANDYLAEISLSQEPCFTSNKLILPEDAEIVGPIVTLHARESGETSTENDTYTWTDLSDDYYYYVQEGTETTPGYLEGYTANYEYTYGDAPDNTQIKEVTITNTPVSESTETSIKVQKKWQTQGADGNWSEVSDTSAANSQLPASVTFKLYRSTTQNDNNLTDDKLVTGVGTQTVTAENDWAYTWSGLPKTTNDDGTGETYYYYVKEADGNLGVYSSEIDHTEGVTGGEIIVTNKITSVTVEKKWLSADGTDISESECSEQSVAVQLYRTDAPGYSYALSIGAQQTLNSENNWVYTWQGLPAGTYYVQEVTVPKGFTTSYQSEAQATENETKSNASEAMISGGKIQITNKKEPASLSVIKEWSDGGENKRDINVKLYRTIIPPEGSTPPDQSSNMNVTVKLNWVESDGTLSTVLPSDGSCQVTFTGNTSQTVTLSSESGWQGNVTLPATAQDGTNLEYTVTYPSELQIDSTTSATVTCATTTISGTNKDHTVELTAKKKAAASSGNNGKFTVKIIQWRNKYWQSIETPNLAEGAYIDVYIHSSSNSWNKIHDDPLRLEAPDWSAEYECSNVDNTATYYVDLNDYTTNITGLRIDKDNITGAGQINVYAIYDDSAEVGTASVASAASVPVTRTFTTASNSVSASEQLVSNSVTDENLLLNVGSEEVTITNAEYMGQLWDKTLSSSNNWKAGWENLDKTDKEGNLYYYYAVETPVNGYDASYEITYVDNNSSEGIASVKIINTKNDTETTSITVQKNWNGSIVDGATYSATFTLYDQKTNQPVNIDGVQTEQTITGNGSYTWSNLPLGTYYVVEKDPKCNNSPITNCTTTYQAGNGTAVAESYQATTTGGTITITNTVTKPGIILPGTGSKYPFVFYGLGLAFLTISTAWMFLTFKKRNTPIDAGKGGRRSKKQNN